MNYTQIVKNAPLKSGFFMLCGPQGVGKTSLATGLLRADYKRWAKWRAEQGNDLANRFYAESGVDLEISDRLYFTNTDIILDRRRNLHTHYIELHKLGLPNDDFEVQFLPRGSVVFIQEADVLALNRDWESLNFYLVNLLKYVRHNLITIIFDCQVGGKLDKALRQLCEGIFYITESGVKRFLLFWKCQKWKFVYVQNQLNAFIKELSSLGVKIKIKVAEWGRFRTFRPVFDCYNSFSGEPYYLYKIEEYGYKYLPHAEGDYSIEGIKRYVEMHPLEKPEEMKRKRG